MNNDVREQQRAIENAGAEHTAHISAEDMGNSWASLKDIAHGNG